MSNTPLPSLRQDLNVVQGLDGLYYVIPSFNQCVLHETSSASEALEFALSGTPQAGGVIQLGPGDFRLDRPVELTNNIWIRGKGRATRLLVTAANTEGVGIFSNEQHGVVISDLAITAGDNPSARAGVVLNGCGDCKIRDVFAVGFADYGIWVRNHSFLCEVRGCSLAGNAKAGIYFDDHRRGKYGDFVPNLITNCIVYGGGKGIDIKATTVINIIACAIYQTGDTGIHVHDVSYSVLISGCRTFQINGSAVVVEDNGELNLSSNIFCWHTEHGVVVRNSGWGTINGNEIIDSGSHNPNAKDFSTRIDAVAPAIPLYDGIQLSGVRGFNISGNAIFNWPQARRMANGIVEDAACKQNNITSNSINYFEGAGVYSKGEGSQVINNLLEKDVPHGGNPREEMLQSFQAELTSQFVDMLR